MKSIEKSTEQPEKKRLGRDDWIVAALRTLHEKGLSGIKIVLLAERMSVTSGSFYWHFKKLQDLLDAVLDHWEHHLTDHIIRDAQAFEGAPEDRIYNLMEQVVREGAADPRPRNLRLVQVRPEGERGVSADGGAPKRLRGLDV